MAANFPTSLDDANGVGSATGPVPAPTDTTNSPAHSGLHQKTGDAIVAVETKIGTGASTPATDQVLVADGSGTSTWTAAAPVATKLATARTVALTGDVTGTSASFDGTGNVTLPAVVTTHGFIGAPSSAIAITASTFPSVVSTNLTLGTEHYDTDGYGSGSNVLTIPAGLAGWYIVSAELQLNTAPTVAGEQYLNLIPGGSAIGGYVVSSAVRAATTCSAGSGIWYMPVGGTVTAVVIANGSGFSASTSTFVSLYRLSA